MDPFMTAVGWNIVAATVLAAVAFAVSRLGRWPQLAHVLWMFVLIKLITPPVIGVTVPQFAAEGQIDRAPADIHGEAEVEPPLRVENSRAAPVGRWRDAEDASHVPAAETEAVTIAIPPTAARNTPTFREQPEAATIRAVDVADDTASIATTAASAGEEHRSEGHWPWSGPVYAVWLLGALIYAAVLVVRYRKVGVLLARSPGVDQPLFEAVRRLANQLGLRRCPAVRVVAARIPPLVWGLGWRPVIVLPECLLQDLNHSQRDTVLVHELAHVLRRDHWVRWLEVIAMVPFWFNPLAWWARRELRRAEEECCDAYVVWHLPEKRRLYGQALLKTVEFLSVGPPAVAAAGSAFGKPFFRRRIEMILKRNAKPKMSWAGWAAVVLLAAAVVPVGAETNETDDTATKSGEAALQPDEKSTKGVEATDAAVVEVNDSGDKVGAVGELLSTGGPPVVSRRAEVNNEALGREAAERARFAGTWNVAIMKQNGRPSPSQFEYYRWYFDADQSKAGTAWNRIDGDAHETEETRRFRFVVNPDASPKELTIYGDNMLIQAIYKWEGDELTICFFGRSEKDRPAQFPGAGRRSEPTSLPVMEFKLSKDPSNGLESTLAAGDDQQVADQDPDAAQERSRDPYGVLESRVALAEDAYRRTERMAQRGFVSQAKLARSQAELAQARATAEQSALQREAQGQLLELDVAEAKIKLAAAETLLSSVKRAHAANAVTDHDVEKQVYDLELARIALQRAEIKLHLHYRQGAAQQAQ